MRVINFYNNEKDGIIRMFPLEESKPTNEEDIQKLMNLNKKGFKINTKRTYIFPYKICFSNLNFISISKKHLASQLYQKKKI